MRWRSKPATTIAVVAPGPGPSVARRNRFSIPAAIRSRVAGSSSCLGAQGELLGDFRARPVGERCIEITPLPASSQADPDRGPILAVPVRGCREDSLERTGLDKGLASLFLSRGEAGLTERSARFTRLSPREQNRNGANCPSARPAAVVERQPAQRAPYVPSRINVHLISPPGPRPTSRQTPGPPIFFAQTDSRSGNSSRSSKRT